MIPSPTPIQGLPLVSTVLCMIPRPHQRRKVCSVPIKRAAMLTATQIETTQIETMTAAYRAIGTQLIKLAVILCGPGVASSPTRH